MMPPFACFQSLLRGLQSFPQTSWVPGLASSYKKRCSILEIHWGKGSTASAIIASKQMRDEMYIPSCSSTSKCTNFLYAARVTPDDNKKSPTSFLLSSSGLFSRESTQILSNCNFLQLKWILISFWFFLKCFQYASRISQTLSLSTFISTCIPHGANLYPYPRWEKKIFHDVVFYIESLMTSRGESAEKLIAFLAKIRNENSFFQWNMSTYLRRISAHHALGNKVSHAPLPIREKCSTKRFAMWVKRKEGTWRGIWYLLSISIGVNICAKRLQSLPSLFSSRKTSFSFQLSKQGISWQEDSINSAENIWT